MSDDTPKEPEYPLIPKPKKPKPIEIDPKRKEVFDTMTETEAHYVLSKLKDYLQRTQAEHQEPQHQVPHGFSVDEMLGQRKPKMPRKLSVPSNPLEESPNPWLDTFFTGVNMVESYFNRNPPEGGYLTTPQNPQPLPSPSSQLPYLLLSYIGLLLSTPNGKKLLDRVMKKILEHFFPEELGEE